jgi:hypothetical protein
VKRESREGGPANDQTANGKIIFNNPATPRTAVVCRPTEVVTGLDLLGSWELLWWSFCFCFV